MSCSYSTAPFCSLFGKLHSVSFVGTEPRVTEVYRAVVISGQFRHVKKTYYKKQRSPLKKESKNHDSLPHEASESYLDMMMEIC